MHLGLATDSGTPLFPSHNCMHLDSRWLAPRPSLQGFPLLRAEAVCLGPIPDVATKVWPAVALPEGLLDALTHSPQEPFHCPTLG